MKIRSTGSQLGTSFGDWFCALFENKRSGGVTQELSLPRTGGGLRAPAAHGVSSIIFNKIQHFSYLFSKVNKKHWHGAYETK